MAQKINRTVVRNDGFTRGSFETRYRHNERQNESYGNGDSTKAANTSTSVSGRI